MSLPVKESITDRRKEYQTIKNSEQRVAEPVKIQKEIFDLKELLKTVDVPNPEYDSREIYSSIVRRKSKDDLNNFISKKSKERSLTALNDEKLFHDNDNNKQIDRRKTLDAKYKASHNVITNIGKGWVCYRRIFGFRKQNNRQFFKIRFFFICFPLQVFAGKCHWR